MDKPFHHNEGHKWPQALYFFVFFSLPTISYGKFLYTIARILKRVWDRFQGMNSASLCSLAGRYDNPLPPRFLAPIDCLKFQLCPLCLVRSFVSKSQVKYYSGLELFWGDSRLSLGIVDEFPIPFLPCASSCWWAMSKRNHPCPPHRVYTEWQQPLSGVHPIKMEILAHASDGGEAHPPPFQYIYHHVQSCSVRSSWEGRYIPTFPLFHLNPYVLCGPPPQIKPSEWYNFRSKVIKGLFRLF
jgi:hypothetical protein